eukprot:g4203.t1
MAFLDLLAERHVGDCLWRFGGCPACNQLCLWWHMCRMESSNLVATLERPGTAALRKSADELGPLQCKVTDQIPGRLYFKVFGVPELLRAVRSVETIGVTVLRHSEDPLGTFLNFSGASTESCMQRILTTVMSADWSKALLFWALLVGQPFSPRSFRVKAKRSTKVGKALVSSDALAEEVGAALLERFGWAVDLQAPELEVRVQLNQEELLVSLTALVQPLGARGCYLAHPGLHPAIAWVLARCLNIEEQDTVLDPMCGRGVLLCEAALNWPHAGAFIGCDLDPDQLRLAAENVANLARGSTSSAHALQLLRADAAKLGGLPLAKGSVDKVLTDLPFGKQFGSLDTNRSLYPAVLAELARVLRTGGLAAVLTSQSNRATMREALAGQAGRPSSWKVEHLRSFRLFVKMDACIYLLRRDKQLNTGRHFGSLVLEAPRNRPAAFGCRVARAFVPAWLRNRFFCSPFSCRPYLHQGCRIFRLRGILRSSIHGALYQYPDESVAMWMKQSRRGERSILRSFEICMIKTWDLVGSYAWSMPFNNGQAHHILQKLPEKCPLHPQRDLLADNGNGSEPGQSVCMADYCEIFGACEADQAPCEAQRMAEQKKRCEKLLLQCFPPGSQDVATRRLHSHYSRKWCRELDCELRTHREEEDLRSLTAISPLLGFIVVLCMAAFAAMILLIGGGDDVLFLMYECGLVPQRLMRSWVQTRDGLRKYAGLPISHALSLKIRWQVWQDPVAGQMEEDLGANLKAKLQPRRPGENLKVAQTVLKRRDRNLQAAAKKAQQVAKRKADERKYKKGNRIAIFVDKDSQEKVVLTDNKLIEKHLGDLGVICTEDLAHVIHTGGKGFEEVMKRLDPVPMGDAKKVQ